MKNKLLKNFCIIFTLIIAISSFASCDVFNMGLESGFDAGGCDDRPSLVAACKSGKKTFDINDVTLDFYYGGKFYDDIENEVRSIQGFELYFKNDEGEKCFVRRSEDNFISEKYRVEVVDGRRVYNHHETLTIPSELFTKEIGEIFFSIYGTDTSDPEPESKNIAGLGLWYKVEGDKVTLSKTHFN